MAKPRGTKSTVEAKKKGKLASKENVPPKVESSESDANESQVDESVDIATKGQKMPMVKQQPDSMEDENDASQTSQSYDDESQTEPEEESPQKAKKTQQMNKNAKIVAKPPPETEAETDDDHDMEQNTRSEHEMESNEEPSPVKPKLMPQAKNAGKLMKMNPLSQSESESESGTENDEEVAQAPKQVPGKKKPAPSKPAPKAAAKAKVMQKNGKVAAKKVLAPLAVEVKTPPTIEMKTKEKIPPAKVKVGPKGAVKKTEPKKMVTEKALAQPKSNAGKTTKGAKVAKTTVAAASKKTAKSATKLNQTAASVAKATTKSNRRLSKVSSMISKYQLKKDATKMSIGDKVIMAIVHLNEDAGSSLRNIISYMSKTYNLDKAKIGKSIRNNLKKMYDEGILVQKRNTDFNINRKFQMKSKKYKNMIANNEENAQSYDDDEDVK